MSRHEGESFLSKVASKVNVVGRDGSFLSKPLLTTKWPTKSDNHLIKPLMHRNLPLTAQKFRATQPKAVRYINTISKRQNIPVAIIQHMEKVSSKPFGEAELLNTMGLEYLDIIAPDISAETTASIEKKASIVNPNILETSNIISHPIQASEISLLNGIPREAADSQKHTIFELEQEADRIRKPKRRAKNQMENVIAKKIIDSGCWTTELMREVTRLIDPIYAADLLKQNILPAVEKEVDPGTAALLEKKYNFYAEYSDNIGPIPATGLLFKPITTYNRAISSGRSSARSSVSRRTSYSRPPTTYSEILKKKMDGKTATPNNPHVGEIQRYSRSILDGNNPGHEFFDRGHDSEGNESENELKTSYNHIELEDESDLNQNFPTLADFQVTLNYSPDELPAPITNSIVKKKPERSKEIEKDENIVLKHADSESLCSASTRSSRRASKPVKFKPAFFPITEIKLGGLGPEKDTQDYLSKIEKKKKQIEYAENIRRKFLTKSKSHVEQSTPPGKDAVFREVVKSNLIRLPSLSKLPATQRHQDIKPEPPFTKHQKMKIYAQKVSSKRGMRSPTKSLPEFRNLPPLLHKVRNASMNKLSDLEKDHLDDMKIAQEIRNLYL